MGGISGGSWGVLGVSGVVPGASWEAFRPSWTGLGGHLVASRFLIVFLIDLGVVLGALKGPKMEPKRDQKRTKIEGKNDVEKRHFSRPSWSRLRAILGHLGSHLGVRESVFVLEKPIREQKSRFSLRSAFKKHFRLNLGRFGRPKGPKGRPKGTQEAPKTRPK